MAGVELRRYARLVWPRASQPDPDPDSSPGSDSSSDGLRLRWQVLVFLASCAILISRRPSTVLHAQFYGEDGAIWFGDAYNWGWWRALFWPFHGYLQVFPRLAAGLALLAPFAYAPLVENLIAIMVQALPVNLLLSSTSRTLGPMRLRTAMAFLYLLLPNTWEMFGTVTLSEWILALCAFLVLAGSPPRSPRARIFPLAILVFSSLTGPFCILLLPIAWLLLRRWWKEPWSRSWSWSCAAVLCLGSLIQGLVLLTDFSSRQPARLGVSIEPFIRILAGNVYLGTVIGTNRYAMHYPLGGMASIAAAGSILLLWGARGASIEIRSLLLLSLLVFAAALATPTIYPPPGTTAWQVMEVTFGGHYWFFPTVAIVWSIVWCAHSGARVLRIISCCLLGVMMVAVVHDYRSFPLPDLEFAKYVRRLHAAPPHSVVVIPVDPPGWTMRLVKR